MSKMEQVGKLVPSVARIVARIDGKAAVDRLSWEEVAGALAGAPGAASDLARAMYGLDRQSARAVANRLRGLAVLDEAPAACAMVAFRLFVSPPHCRVCQGRATVMHEGRVVATCEHCYGSGYEMIDLGEVAAEEGVAAWVPTIERMTLALHEWHDAALAAIVRGTRP